MLARGGSAAPLCRSGGCGGSGWGWISCGSSPGDDVTRTCPSRGACVNAWLGEPAAESTSEIAGVPNPAIGRVWDSGPASLVVDLAVAPTGALRLVAGVEQGAGQQQGTPRAGDPDRPEGREVMVADPAHRPDRGADQDRGGPAGPGAAVLRPAADAAVGGHHRGGGGWQGPGEGGGRGQGAGGVRPLQALLELRHRQPPLGVGFAQDARDPL